MNVTVLPVVEVRRTGTGKNDVLPDRTNRPARVGPTAVRPVQNFRSTASVVHIPHTPGSILQALVFHQRSWFRYIPVATKSQQPLRSHQDRLILVDAHLRRPPVGHSDRRLASCSVSLPHSFSPSGWNGECISRPRLRRSWRTRHRPPLRHTGLTALPWPRPAPSALAAPPRAPKPTS